MEQARAAALLFADDSSEADRLAAVEVLRERGDIDSRSLLASLVGADQPAVAKAAAAAIAAIDRDLQLWSILQSVYYGLSLGSVLLLAAAGLAITFGVMGVINMAHGEMVMIGAYVTFMVQQVIRDAAPGLFGASLLVAVPLAFIVAGTDRHRDRAHADPLAVWPAAGDAAGHLGAVAGPAAGGALAVRPEQPRRRHARLDERRDPTRRPDDHL